MTLPDYFHEARRALEGIRHEFTAVGSVNAAGINSVPHACEMALRGLYVAAVAQPFPQNRFKPHHQPESLAKQLGVTNYYSTGSQGFLKELTGRALSDARYPGSDAHEKYTNATSGTVSYYLIEEAERFVGETVAIAHDPVVLGIVRSKAGS